MPTERTRDEQSRSTSSGEGPSDGPSDLNTIQKMLPLRGAVHKQSHHSASPPPSSLDEHPSPIDLDSKKGRFGWYCFRPEMIVPYLLREGIEYCPVRVLDHVVVGKIKGILPAEVTNCAPVPSFHVTEDEARLLNEIKSEHCATDELSSVMDESILPMLDSLFTTEDCMVLLSDAKEFYSFLCTCLVKLTMRRIARDDRCGFVLINGEEPAVPFVVKDGERVVPVEYFQGPPQKDMSSLMSSLPSFEATVWDLAYLKFCGKVQGIRGTFEGDSCRVVRLEAIKRFFGDRASMELYWPPVKEGTVAESQLLIAQQKIRWLQEKLAARGLQNDELYASTRQVLCKIQIGSFSGPVRLALVSCSGAGVAVSNAAGPPCAMNASPNNARSLIQLPPSCIGVTPVRCNGIQGLPILGPNFLSATAVGRGTSLSVNRVRPPASAAASNLAQHYPRLHKFLNGGSRLPAVNNALPGTQIAGVNLAGAENRDVQKKDAMQ